MTEQEPPLHSQKVLSKKRLSVFVSFLRRKYLFTACTTPKAMGPPIYLRSLATTAALTLRNDFKILLLSVAYGKVYSY